MCQLCHYRRVRGVKDCIGFCQFFQILALCSHSIHDCLYFLDHLMVLFWRGRWCTVDILHCCVVPAFSCGFYRSFLLSVLSVEKSLYFAHVLRSADCCLHSLMSSFKILVCASRVINFDIIIAPEIVWTPDTENSLPFLTVRLVGLGVQWGRMAPSS